MKDKEKQINEMANDYYGYSIDLEEDCKFVAKEMYDKGHRKLNKDSVVLTREEYEELKQSKTLLELREETIKYLEDANIRYAKALELKVNEKERKETAEKIFNSIFKLESYNDGWNELYYKDHIIQLAKQFGIEIKE